MIGSAVPGSPTTITPDLGHAGYTSAQGPAPDGQYEADDINQAIQIALNVQAHADTHLQNGTLEQMIDLEDVQMGWHFDAADYGRYYATLSSQDFGLPWTQASTGTPGIYWRHENTYIVRQDAAGTGALADVGLCRVGPMLGIDAGTPNGRIPKSVVQNHLHYTSALARATLLYESLGSGEYFDPPITLLGGSLPDLVVGDQVTGIFGPVLVRSWASDYAEVQVSLLQDLDGENGGPTLNVMGRFRITPASPTPAMVPVLIPFNQTVTVAGDARVQLDAGAGNGNLDIEGVDNTTYRLGSVTVFRP